MLLATSLQLSSLLCHAAMASRGCQGGSCVSWQNNSRWEGLTCAPLGDSPERLKELCVLLKGSQEQARPTFSRDERWCSSALHHWPVLSDASGLSFGWGAWCFKPTDKQAEIRCGCEGISSDKHSERRKHGACTEKIMSVMPMQPVPFGIWLMRIFWGRWKSFAQGFLLLAFTEVCVCQRCSTFSLRPVSPVALENGSGMLVSKRSVQNLLTGLGIPH